MRADLPEEAGLAAAALLYVAVQGVVADVGAPAVKEGRVHLPLPPVKVVPHMVFPPLQSTAALHI